MAIRVTIIKTLDDDLWGAEECLDGDGERALKFMLMDDVQALMDGATFKFVVTDD